MEETSQNTYTQTVSIIDKNIGSTKLELFVSVPLDYDTEYAIVIPTTSIRDISGNTLAADKIITFRTQLDPIQLAVMGSDPTQGSVQVPISKNNYGYVY
ncbi:MAG: Ig-like domain-containing protein [Rubrobacteridae bacterium]|nr:Ig-like domain-containing protein [Rubrobacteridae bacterium]